MLILVLKLQHSTCTLKFRCCVILYVAERYNNMAQRETTEGLEKSSLDDSLINITGTIHEFCCMYLIILSIKVDSCF